MPQVYKAKLDGHTDVALKILPRGELDCKAHQVSQLLLSVQRCACVLVRRSLQPCCVNAASLTVVMTCERHMPLR